MTKDGRPSLINDIRLFAGGYSYLTEQEEAVAYGRRMAWFLNSEGFSLGAFPALYVSFTSLLKPASVQVTDRHAEWWHRCVDIGVIADFPEVPDTLEIITRGIVDALLAIKPDGVDMIRRADEFVRKHGRSLRFLLKRHETKKLVTEIAFNIEAWPKPSYLFISNMDKTSGVYSEADPIPLGWYMEGFDLLSGIRRQDAINMKEAVRRPAMSGVVKRRG